MTHESWRFAPQTLPQRHVERAAIIMNLNHLPGIGTVVLDADSHEFVRLSDVSTQRGLRRSSLAADGTQILVTFRPRDGGGRGSAMTPVTLAPFHQPPGYDRTVQFSRDLRERVLSGDISVTFRLWSRPQVKVGGRYRVGPGEVEVDSIELVPFAVIDETDLRDSGEPDRESLRRRAAHAGPVHDDTLLYRIEFHVVEE